MNLVRTEVFKHSTVRGCFFFNLYYFNVLALSCIIYGVLDKSS